jgi:hypothetical protein
MQEPQYRSAGRARTAGQGGRSRVPCMSIMNMPPLPYLKRIPGSMRRAAETASPTPASGTASIRPDDAVQPRPAGLPAARGEGQRAAGAPADQLQGRALRFRRHTGRSCASSRLISRPPRFDAGEASHRAAGEAEGARLDVRAARQVGDADRRQLPLRAEDGMRPIKDAVHSDLAPRVRSMTG